MVREYSRGAQTDSSAHHHRHNDICLKVEKPPERLAFFAVAHNSFCVFYAHFVKHRSEQQENNDSEEPSEEEPEEQQEGNDSEEIPEEESDEQQEG